jgi:hypothetical protein
MTSYWKSILSRLNLAELARKSNRRRPRKSRSSTLALERLEDRSVPAFLIRFSTDGGSTFGAPIADNGPGDLNPNAGIIVALESNFTITVNSIGSTSLQQSSLELSISGSADPNTTNDIVLQATIDGVVTAPAPQTLAFANTGSILSGGGDLSGGVTMRTWVDNSNTQFGTTGPGIVADTGNKSIPSTGSLSFSGAVPYSVTSQIRATFATTANTASISLDDTNTITPSTTKQVGGGDFATIGFWNNKNGQGVINSFNGGSTHTELGNWLASQFPHLFGSFAGKTNAQIATAFQTAFGNGGVQSNTFAQAFAVALGIYADTTSLGGQSLIDNGKAAKFGFNVSAGGGGSETYSISSNDQGAFPLLGTSPTVLQIMQTVDNNYNSATGLFYGGDQNLTSEANDVLSGINQKGDII